MRRQQVLSAWGSWAPARPGSVSLFWSIRLDRVAAARAAGVDAFRRELVELAPVAAELTIPSMDVLRPAALADASSLAGFEAARRGQARFYAFGARALNTVFQSDLDVMARPRDHLFPVASRMFRRRALAVLSGRAAGLWRDVTA